MYNLVFVVVFGYGIRIGMLFFILLVSIVCDVFVCSYVVDVFLVCLIL